MAFVFEVKNIPKYPTQKKNKQKNLRPPWPPDAQPPRPQTSVPYQQDL